MSDKLSLARVALGNSAIGFVRSVMEIFLPKSFKKKMMRGCFDARIPPVQTTRFTLRIVGLISRKGDYARIVSDFP